MINESEMQIMGRLLQLKGRKLSPELAQVILAADFSADEKRRIIELGEKSNEGTLTPDERDLQAAYVRVIDLFGILQSRARSVLKKYGKTG
jgi:hypothetical protein